MFKKILLFTVVCSGVLFFFNCGGQAHKQIFADSTDIGDIKLKGSTSYDPKSGDYTLTGAGFNIWGEQDAFHFAWKEVDGDFVLTADVAFEGEGVNPHRKLGLMLRETLDADSRYADVAVHGDGLTSLQYRASKHGTSAEVVSPNKAPNKIQLERKGDRFIIRTGIDSIPTEADAEITLELPAKAYLGLFIGSHEDQVLETAHFSNIVLKR